MGIRDFHFKVKVSQMLFYFSYSIVTWTWSLFEINKKKKIMDMLVVIKFKGKIIYGLDPFEIMLINNNN